MGDPPRARHLTCATIRDAANDIAQDCDPTDLATATDRFHRHLARPRTLATDPPVEFRVTDLALTLRPDDEAAIAALLAAQRRQAIVDVLRRQKTEALCGCRKPRPRSSGGVPVLVDDPAEAVVAAYVEVGGLSGVEGGAVQPG
ncbi:hypothetical protein ACWFR5_21295 [Streptomyces sp. NPDC055092]